MRKGELSVFSNNITFGMLRESSESFLQEDIDKKKAEEAAKKKAKKNKNQEEEKKEREPSLPPEFYDLYSVYKNSGFRSELALS